MGQILRGSRIAHHGDHPLAWVPETRRGRGRGRGMRDEGRGVNPVAIRHIRLMVIAALIAGTAPAGAAAVLRVAYGRRVVTTNAPVVAVSGGPLVPLRAVAQALGGRMRWDEASRVALVQHG